MRASCLWLCLGLLLPGSVMSSQELAKSHPKYQMAYRIYQRIADAAGGAQRPPELVIYPSGEPGNKWKGAGFEYTPAPTIFLEEKLIDLCGAFGARQADALAVVLGHELAHFYREHRLNTSFAAPSGENRIRMESEADYHGAFYGSLAGYHTVQMLPEVFDLVYEAYKLPDQIAGYPQKEERYRLVRNHVEELSSLTNAFFAGQLLYLQKEYQAAADCFHYVADYFPSREIYNNEGVSYLALALKYAKKEDQYYAYPFELDPATRLKNLEKRSFTGNESEREAQMEKWLNAARESLERAIALDPAYHAAYINLACVNILQDNAFIAVGRINELNQDRLPPNAYLVRAIAYEKIGKMDEARRDFATAEQLVAYRGAYNRQLFERSDSRLRQIADHLDNSLRKWIDDWWSAGQNCSSAKDRAIGDLSFLDLVDPDQASHQFKIPRKPVKFAVFDAAADARGLFIHFAGEKEDYDLYFISARRTFRGETGAGIGIGSPVNKVVEQYCEPDYIYGAANNNRYLLYEDLQMIFHIEEEMVRTWYLFRY